MADLIAQLTLVVTAVLGWVGDCVDVIVANPLLLITTGVLMVGAACGILGRLLSKN